MEDLTLNFDVDMNIDTRPPEELSDRELLEAMYKFIRNINREYDVKTENIEINTTTLCSILGVSRRTVVRWRSDKMLRFHIDARGNAFHRFTELYVDVKSGRIKGRGFSREAALARLRLYRLGVIKGYLKTEYDSIYGGQ